MYPIGKNIEDDFNQCGSKEFLETVQGLAKG